MGMRKPVEGELRNCPVRAILDRVMDRWSLLVLLQLQEEGTLRFSELRRNLIDISQRMLSQTVRRLEEDGFISRKVYPTVPPRVEYTLTELGISLLQPLGILVEWADLNHAEILRARASFQDKP